MKFINNSIYYISLYVLYSTIFIVYASDWNKIDEYEIDAMIDKLQTSIAPSIMSVQEWVSIQEKSSEGLFYQEKPLQLTILNAVERAWNFNKDLRQAKNIITDTQNRKKGYYLRFIPKITASVSSSVPHISIINTQTAQNITVQSAINAQLTLFDYSLFTELNTLIYQLQDAQITEEIVKQKIGVQVIKQLYTVMMNRNAIRLQMFTINLNKYYYQSANNDYKSGRISRIDMLQAKNTYENSQISLLTMQYAYISALNTLRTFLGVSYKQKLHIIVKIPQPDEFKQLFISQYFPYPDIYTPELRKKELEIKNQQISLNIIYQKFIPKITVDATMGIVPFSTNLTHNVSSSMNLNATVNINVMWDLSAFFPYSTAWNEQKRNKKILQLQKESQEDIIRDYYYQYSNTIQELESTYAQYMGVYNGIKVSEERWKEAELLFTEGNMSYDALEEIRQNLVKSQNQLSNLGFNIMQLLIDLGGRINFELLEFTNIHKKEK